MSKAGEWIEWNGGECPVDEDDLVDLKFRKSAGLSGLEAGSFDWKHENMDDDIIAYRVVKP